MMTLDQLKKEKSLINEIDWDMTPEEAVRLYLEWGNNWSGGNYVIRSKNDVSFYFVVNTWKEEPRVFLVKRSSETAEELAAFPLPEGVREPFLESVGRQKGVYAISGPVREWLEKELGQ
ncbi:MAG: DVU0772 family protein [Thermodesulfobacteriota bacterium]